MYLLQERIHYGMDKERSHFFWRGADTNSFKYHMVRWDNVCLPKDMGGLGIINTRYMNEALLTKWIWRIQKNDPDDLCIQVLRKKYMSNNIFYRTKGDGGSQFWVGLHKVKHHMKKGLKCQVNNGKDTLFWEDVWLKDVPLRLYYQRIFSKCGGQMATVAEVWKNGAWDLQLRRNLTMDDLESGRIWKTSYKEFPSMIEMTR